MNPVTLPAAWAPDQSPEARAVVAPPCVAGWPRAKAAGGGPAWSLQRRCALKPRQFAACLGALLLLPALVATFFWLQDVRFVALFSGIEMLVLGLAFGWHALHAADGETLQLHGWQLLLVSRRGLDCRREWIDTVGLRAGLAADGSIELRTQGRRWRLGRQTDGRRRQQVLAELRAAMTHTGAMAPSGT